MPQQQCSTWQRLERSAQQTAKLIARLLNDEESDGESIAEDDGTNLEGLADRSIVLITGQGETGTIGLMAARYLAEHDAWVQVLTLVPQEQHAGIAADALNSLIAADVPLTWAEDGWELPPCDLLIDAVSGENTADNHHENADAVRKLIELINSSLAPILGIGMPSALKIDQAEPLFVRASATIVFEPITSQTPPILAAAGKIYHASTV